MSALSRDIRYALRMLIKQPGFTFAAVLTMGLSIAATTIVFSLADKLVVHPYADVPYHDRLVWFFETDGKLDTDHDNVALANYVDWKEQAKSFDHMGPVTGTGYNVSIAGHTRTLHGSMVWHDFFEMLGVDLAVGHGFEPDANVAGHDHVAIISDELWQTQFGRRPDVVGQTLTLDGASWQVVGVLPPRFAFFKGVVDLYVPAVPAAELFADRARTEIDVIGRLREGVTIEEARAELHTIAMRLAKTYPATNAGKDTTVVAIDSMFVGVFRSPVYLLLVAVGFVLLIGCANVSNLLLSRAILRRREAAIRTAVGTTAGRLVRQLLTESVVLALFGCGLGVLLAWWGIDALLRAVPSSIVHEVPRVGDVSLDARVLGAAVVVSIMTGLLFGLVPALRVASTDVVSALKDGDRGGTSTRGRIRDVLIAAELALATVLLVAAGMSSRAFAQAVHQPLGFEPEHVVVGMFNLALARYPRPDAAGGYATPPVTQAFLDRLITRATALPGVTSAAVGSDNGAFNNARALYQFVVEGDPPLPPAQQPYTAFTAISPTYLDVAKIPLFAGRAFSASDIAGGPNVILISSAFARRYFPDGHAIGRHIRWPEDGVVSEIVGIVGDVRAVRGSTLGDIHAYATLSQTNPFASLFILARTTNEPSSSIAPMRSLIEELDPQIPIWKVDTLAALVDEDDAPLRFLSILLAMLAVLGLVLAAIGAYGVMSYAVSQRTNEIGIRMALGAQSSDVMWLVLRRGIIIALVGLGVGVVASLALAHVASALLFGAPSYDPIALVCSSLLLFATACIACYLPARRATRIDPLVALRSE
jgi:putative ABC transport system permease protein